MTSKLLPIILLSLLCCACGKYAKPLAPEILAPNAVRTLQVTADNSGVNFQWDAPDSDRRGKELRTMTGYLVYRKELKQRADAVDDSVQYEVVGTIVDTHIEVLKQKRAELKEKGVPQRRATVDAELTHFQFSDRTTEPGHTYLYKIVPINQGDVEGEVRQAIRIVFTGESSQIDLKDVQEAEGEEQI